MSTVLSVGGKGSFLVSIFRASSLGGMGLVPGSMCVFGRTVVATVVFPAEDGVNGGG